MMHSHEEKAKWYTSPNSQIRESMQWRFKNNDQLAKLQWNTSLLSIFPAWHHNFMNMQYPTDVSNNVREIGYVSVIFPPEHLPVPLERLWWCHSNHPVAFREWIKNVNEFSKGREMRMRSQVRVSHINQNYSEWKKWEW